MTYSGFIRDVLERLREEPDAVIANLNDAAAEIIDRNQRLASRIRIDEEDVVFADTLDAEMTTIAFGTAEGLWRACSQPDRFLFERAKMLGEGIGTTLDELDAAHAADDSRRMLELIEQARTARSELASLFESGSA